MLLAFYPKILGGGRNLGIVILLKKECSFSSADNVYWWGYSNTTRWLKIELDALTGDGMQKLFDFPNLLSDSVISSASTPYEPHGETFATQYLIYVVT